MTPLIKILIITTSHASMGGSGEQTGVWLEELTTPYDAVTDAGAHVTVASIAGGAVPVDPRSIGDGVGVEPSVGRYLKDERLREAVRTSARVTAEMADGYDAVFLPGGHGTMWDYPQSEAVAQLVVRYLMEGKVVAAVCHGPAGLVSARSADGVPVIKGRRVAGFTNSEERAAGLDAVVPFLLEDRLRSLGGRYETGPDFKPFAIRDGNLITGQNPASATEVARLTLQAVGEKRLEQSPG
jgi:putative intracellular protease/amidase